MSGYSTEQPCPICGGNMSIDCDSKPFESVSGDCINCGFCYYPTVEQMSLAEINERRADEDLKPLKLKDIKKYSKEIKEL